MNEAVVTASATPSHTLKGGYSCYYFYCLLQQPTGGSNL
ncbi:hypothetical protein [Enterococcus phage vB_Efs19_KEN17]